MKRIICTTMRGAMVIGLSLVLLGLCIPTIAAAQCRDCEGCTPGYWKQEQHLGNWCADYSPEDIFDDVFGVTLFGPDVTLMDALGMRGRDAKDLGLPNDAAAMARHAVAGLLNYCSADVNYCAGSINGIIWHVQWAVLTGDYETVKDEFEARNELDCPLGRAELVD